MSTAEIPATALPALPPVTLQTSAIHETRQIPIAELHESPWNPRKYFPEESMKQLVNSMRVHGFWEWSPLMTRPRKAGGYEIGAGHRRYRAAQKAGLKTLPAIVRKMDDAAFLAVLTFDNSNREDPHPLDEAAGFQLYMNRTGAKVQEIAERIGQSIAYVYQRLKYADLIEAAKKAFWDEKITAGHAVLIARLPPAQQKPALESCIGPYGDNGVRALARWIENNVHRDVKKACFDSADRGLLEGVPACTVCRKRAGSSPDLFPDIKHPDTCTDPVCFSRKEDAYIQIQIAKRNADPDPKKKPLLKVAGGYVGYGEKLPANVLSRDQYEELKDKKDSCDSAQEAIAVAVDRGRIMQVCADKKCKKHATAHSGRYAPSPQQKAAEKKRIEENRRAELVEKRSCAAIAEKVAVPFTKKELGIFGRYLIHGVNARLLAKELGIKPVEKKTSWGKTQDYGGPLWASLSSLPLEKLARTLIGWTLSQDEDVLKDAVKDYGVDVGAIRKAVDKEALAVKGAETVSAKKPGSKAKTKVSGRKS